MTLTMKTKRSETKKTRLCRTSDEHCADGEDLLGVRVGTHVAEPDAGQAAEGEVERRDVRAPHRRAPRRAVGERRLQALAQLVEPPWGGGEGRHKGVVVRDLGMIWQRFAELFRVTSASVTNHLSESANRSG